MVAKAPRAFAAMGTAAASSVIAAGHRRDVLGTVQQASGEAAVAVVQEVGIHLVAGLLEPGNGAS